MSTWNSGDTYNLLFHTLGANDYAKGVADDAKDKGYFGGENGKESKEALETITQSVQYHKMVEAAHAQTGDFKILGPGKYQFK